jgi:hypothetical protein
VEGRDVRGWLGLLFGDGAGLTDYKKERSNMVKLVLAVTWMLNHSAAGNPKIEAWIPGQTRYPALAFMYKPDKTLATSNGTQVLMGDFPTLIEAVVIKQELVLGMEFSVLNSKVWPGAWFNNRIQVNWIGHDGSERSGSIGPFNYNVNYNMTNAPQWFFSENPKGQQYRDILWGGLIPVFKNMVELTYKEALGDRVASLESEYKRKTHKRTISKKLRRELHEMLPDDGVHNAFCTRCGMFYSNGEDEMGTPVVKGCSLGVFNEFETSDIVEDMYERHGASSDGDNLRSNRGDALWAWVTPEDQRADVALGLSDWMRIGLLIDQDSKDLASEMELQFSSFEYLYDDTLWIDHLFKKGVLENCSDLDATIQEHRHNLLIKMQYRYARLFPAYEDLFLQRTTDSSASRAEMKQQDEMALEEVGEKAHKLSLNNFLDTEVLSPCAYGFTSRKNKDGTYKTYQFRGYPIPESMGNDLIEKL